MEHRSPHIFFEYPRPRKTTTLRDELYQHDKYQVRFGETLKITSDFLEILLQKWKYFNKEIGEITSKLNLLKEKEQETGNKTYAYFKVDGDQVKMVNLSPNLFAFYLKWGNFYERIVDNFRIPTKPLHVKMTFYGISLLGFKMGVNFPQDREKPKIWTKFEGFQSEMIPRQLGKSIKQKGYREKSARKGFKRTYSNETIRHSSLVRSTPNKSSSKIIICTVCLDKKSNWRGVLDCTHDYCFECIQKWMEDNNNCPICKRKSLLVREFRKKRFIRSHKVAEMFKIEEIESNVMICVACNTSGPIHQMVTCMRCNNVSLHIECAQFSTRGPVNYQWLCDQCIMPSNQGGGIETNLNLSIPQVTQHTVPNSENSVDSEAIHFPHYRRIQSANNVPKQDIYFSRWERDGIHKRNCLSGEYSFSGTLRIKRRVFREYADKKPDPGLSGGKPSANSRFYHGDNYTFIEQYSAERFSVGEIKRVKKKDNPFLEDESEEQKDCPDTVKLKKRSYPVSLNSEKETPGSNPNQNPQAAAHQDNFVKPKNSSKKVNSDNSQGDLRVINEFSAKTKSISSIDNFTDRGEPNVEKFKRVNFRMKSPTANMKYEELPIQRVKDEIFERIFHQIQSMSREKSVSKESVRVVKKDPK